MFKKPAFSRVFYSGNILMVIVTGLCDSTPMMKPSREDIPLCVDAVVGLDDDGVWQAVEIYQAQLERAIQRKDCERMVRVGQILVLLGRRTQERDSKKHAANA